MSSVRLCCLLGLIYGHSAKKGAGNKLIAHILLQKQCEKPLIIHSEETEYVYWSTEHRLMWYYSMLLKTVLLKTTDTSASIGGDGKNIKKITATLEP